MSIHVPPGGSGRKVTIYYTDGTSETFNDVKQLSIKESWVHVHYYDANDDVIVENIRAAVIKKVKQEGVGA